MRRLVSFEEELAVEDVFRLHCQLSEFDRMLIKFDEDESTQHVASGTPRHLGCVPVQGHP